MLRLGPVRRRWWYDLNLCSYYTFEQILRPPLAEGMIAIIDVFYSPC